MLLYGAMPEPDGWRNSQSNNMRQCFSSSFLVETEKFDNLWYAWVLSISKTLSIAGFQQLKCQNKSVKNPDLYFITFKKKPVSSFKVTVLFGWILLWSNPNEKIPWNRNVTKCKPIGNEICDLTRFLLFKGWIWSGEDILSKWFGNYSLLYICFIDSTRLQKWRYFRNRAKWWKCQKVTKLYKPPLTTTNLH